MSDVSMATEVPDFARRGFGRSGAILEQYTAKAKSFAADEGVSCYGAFLAGYLTVALDRECVEVERLREEVRGLTREVARLRDRDLRDRN